jgi:hypothetical protein
VSFRSCCGQWRLNSGKSLSPVDPAAASDMRIREGKAHPRRPMVAHAAARATCGPEWAVLAPAEG